MKTTTVGWCPANKDFDVPTATVKTALPTSETAKKMPFNPSVPACLISVVIVNAQQFCTPAVYSPPIFWNDLRQERRVMHGGVQMRGSVFGCGARHKAGSECGNRRRRGGN
jgi:hypothetical protein